MHLQLNCVLLVLQSLAGLAQEHSSHKLKSRDKSGAQEQTKTRVDPTGAPCPTKFNGCLKPVTTERVIDCNKCERHQFRNQKNCVSHPSEPLNINYTFIFNPTTLKLSLELKWDPPQYGYAALWGYDIWLDSKCIQIIGNRTEDGHYTYHGLNYREHHVVISSLPRRSSKFPNSLQKVVEPPERCAMFRKHGIQPPFDCRLVKNLRVMQPCAAGVNESVVVAFDRPQWSDYDAIILTAEPDDYMKCNPKDKIVDKAKVEESTSLNMTTEITGLVVGCTYNLRVYLTRRKVKPRDSKTSEITFKCEKFAKPTTSTPKVSAKPMSPGNRKHSNKTMVYLVSAFTSVIILAMAACVLVRYWQVKRQRQQQTVRLRYQNRAAANEQESVGLESSQPMVMILWCHGCKELENFVLLFAALLQGSGFLVKLDLLESNVVAEQGGLANYLVRGEDDAYYVIVVCTNNKDNSFKFILDIIRNKIMNKGCQARYVPVHLQQEMTEVVPPCLQGTAYRVPEKVEEIIQRMYKVPIYTLEEQPVVNTMCLDQACMESLKKAATSFLKPKHDDCDSANCVKGVAPGDRIFETTSYNSFTSEEVEMLLAPTPDIAQNRLSCSEDSFVGSDLDEEERC